MAVNVKVDIENLDKLRRNFERNEDLALKYLSQAVRASIFEVEKEAVDSNFQFKTPRSKRTGDLQKSFQYGRYIKGLYGQIGPTIQYAPYVYFGTSRGIKANKYIDRIAKASTEQINKHFGTAIEYFLDDISKT